MAKLDTSFRGLNMLTFDIEEWFHANYDNNDLNGLRGKGSNFRAQMDKILQLCSDQGCKATFFVLGSIGEDYPDAVRALVREGHEVASHGYSHQLAYKQTFDEFRADVKRSVDILEQVTGAKILGYRAPSWSIVESNLYYLEALEELGLTYDASIFPVKTFLYGIPAAPTVIHKPQVNGRQLNLYEVPMSVVTIGGRNMGYSGGFYFRFFPAFFVKNVIHRANRQGKSAIIYLHPRELDPGEQRLKLPCKEAFIHFYNIHSTEGKLKDILKTFSFTTVSHYLKAAEISAGD